MDDYVDRLRSQLGSQPIQLNFAAACIVNDNGDVLMQHRADDNKWGIPGGAVEYGEAADAAVVREVAMDNQRPVTRRSMPPTFPWTIHWSCRVNNIATPWPISGPSAAASTDSRTVEPVTVSL